MTDNLEKVVAVKEKAPKAPNDLTEKQAAIVSFLQANPGEFLFAEVIAEGVGSTSKSVNPILTSLAKRDIVEKSEGTRMATLKAGTVEKTYKTYRLTQIGLDIVLN